MPGEIVGGRNAISFNTQATVGVMATGHHTTNQTRSALFNPRYLKMWAKTVHEAYGDQAEVEVIFTPDRPMVAVKSSDKAAKVGIGVAPRTLPEEVED